MSHVMPILSTESDFCVVPAGLQLAASQPVPVGWMRVSDTRIVDVQGFLRDIVSSMAVNAMDNGQGPELLQTVAASAGVEIARSVSPALGQFMESLCFPLDDASPSWVDPGPFPPVAPADIPPQRCAGCDIPNGCPEYCRCGSPS